MHHLRSKLNRSAVTALVGLSGVYLTNKAPTFNQFSGSAVFSACDSLTKIQRIKLSSGNEYHGETVHSEPHGKGSIHFPDGAIFEGTFLNGKLTRDKGIIRNSPKYEGEVIMMIPNGKGRLVQDLPEGLVISEGEFVNGQLHGWGKTIFPDADFSVEGEFVDNIPNGRITYKINDKIVFNGIAKVAERGNELTGTFTPFEPIDGVIVSYTGTTIDNLRHGWCIETFENGFVKKTEYINGEARK